MRRTFGVQAQGLLVGTVGRLHPQKGFASLLAAVARVRERLPAIRLLLVGGGALRRDLVARAEALGLAEVVIFAGSRGDVPEILAALDLFVLPSLWEGLPNAVLEAMAAGLPVVATAAGGTPEVVVDGETGLLVPPGDVTALAEAIERLLRDPGLRRKMGEAGRKRVEGHFTIEQTVAQTVALYETLLRQKGLWV
jgi:glycosyltransferase involved in cell wall biosynthesis